MKKFASQACALSRTQRKSKKPITAIFSCMLAANSPARRLLRPNKVVIPLASWFRHESMEYYEMLCRGSAFSVRAHGQPGHYLVTCSHVAAPWRWPRLYPQPWLQHVSEEITCCVVHVPEPTPKSPVEHILMSRSIIHHEKLDLCVMRFDDESDALQRLISKDIKLDTVALRSTGLPDAGKEVVGCGLAVYEQASTDPCHTPNSIDEDHHKASGHPEHITELKNGLTTITLDLSTDPIPRQWCISLGHISQFRDGTIRGFASMDQSLPDGVCGAPLFEASTQQCIGMIEGTVPIIKRTSSGIEGSPDPSQDIRQALSGHAAFVYGSEIAKLVDQAVKARI